MTPKCAECGQRLDTKKQVENHWKKFHGSEIETPEEHLPSDDSRPADFNGNVPTESGHDPEYIEENDPPETEQWGLFDYE